MPRTDSISHEPPSSLRMINGSIALSRARVRGVKIGIPSRQTMLVTSAVVQEDRDTIRDDFAESFYAVNGITGVKKAF
ncbi:hypothetical protein Z517_09386 [Fonsecaea pedrosoi CBS 271.37]|uniref:Uncharacterized protein n=1 Tax=Fonsecaea pedrosoi CBS 271.37 TaxID=1442368 RepID=A0A0D2ERS1_9EURO|nr:uncharacterized protein Z517_09386 [Fonsecaea pedrosoi CBS 271.37]KIW76942.1 hypothetical protein Z517_09386 [Fonsecaea pedrosoi CBS 271.37]